jgi:Bacterial Ig-like domain (group 3)/Putative Ig domain/Immunoglobulin I-set domain
MARKRGLLIGIVPVVSLALMALAPAGPAMAATTLTVSTTTDTNPASGPCQSGSVTPPSPLSLRDAVCVADNIGGTVTISVPAGTYGLQYGELQAGLTSGQDLTIAGAGAASTVIDAQGHSRVLDFDANLTGGITATVQDVTITGGSDSTFGGAGIIAGSGTGGTADKLTIDASVITGNHANDSAQTATNNPGGGVQFIGGELIITNSTISNNSAHSSPGAAVYYQAEGQATPESFTMSGSTVSGNTGANTTGSTVPTEGAVDLSAPPGTAMSVRTSAFTGNALTGTSGPVLGAALTIARGVASVTGSSFTGNSVSGPASGSGGGAIAVEAGSATITGDRIVGNQAGSPAVGGGIDNAGATVTATGDWWGCNAGPGATGCDSVSGAVTSAPWLKLSAPAVTLAYNGTAPVTADMTHDSAGASVSGPEDELDGVTAAFSDPQPAGTACSPGSVTFSGGTATSSCTFAPQGQTGAGHVVITVDNQAITVPVTITKPATVTGQPSDTTVNPGATASFTAAADGYPAPTVQWQVSSDGGSTYTDVPGATSTTLSFTATAAQTGNMYRAVFTNSTGSGTTHAATLTVGQAPSFTSAPSATFTAGTDGSFTVTTSAAPAATISEAGALPSGVSFTDNGDGTATLSGTPAAGTGGTYPVTLHASNGIDPAAGQSFTLTVDEAPHVTSPASAAFSAGSAGTFTVTTAGYPAPALTESGTLPAGVTFTDNGDGTATLAGTPTVAGTFPLTVSAANSAGSGSQSFTLTVTALPQTITFTSSPPSPAVTGESYAVTATGGPSGNPVTFSIDAGSAGVCTISSSIVTFTRPGACVIDAAQAGDAQYAPASGSQTVPVTKADTSTVVTVHPHDITAAVTAVAPGAGTPTGSVTFSVDGSPVGTAPLTGGTATLTYTVPAGQSRAVSAAYGGDSGFTGSSASTTRDDPSITATVTSPIPKTASGWYRTAVTITFQCTTHGAPLTAPCPPPVRLSHDGAGQSVTRTITATDGGAATVTVSGINIDTVPPRVRISGVKAGATYFGSAPPAHCAGSDKLSGIASCTLSFSDHGDAVTVTATAADRAGNTSQAKVTYTVLHFYVLDAPYRSGAFQLREGHTYTIVALTASHTRPRLYQAAPAGQTPHPAGPYLKRAGSQDGLHRFTVRVCIGRGMGRHFYWNFGVKAGPAMHLIKFHPVS